ncbi:unnamed protein product [Rotaria sp. Silwood2]|nr:unnamed protein product [Rotaria sp. Silwood2]CAF4365207.1 unnamed protein product [Rotaria sp. Silwood2]
MISKKRQQQQPHGYHLNNFSNVTVHHQSKQIESTLIEHTAMSKLQLSLDLAKRKYIYKDITVSNTTNPSEINRQLFQCTLQSSSMSCFDQCVTNVRFYILLRDY